jgi:hypothetical protein
MLRPGHGTLDDMPNDTLHLAAWNLNHRTGRKSIPPAVIHAIASLDIDVLVLTEFVDGAHHDNFKDSLKDVGFEGIAVSVKAPRQNQVLLAARTPLVDDGLLPLPGLDLEVVGFRAPMYLTADDRSGYWRQVETIVRSARDRRVIFLGDFNTDPHSDTRPCAAVFPRLQAEGFQEGRVHRQGRRPVPDRALGVVHQPQVGGTASRHQQPEGELGLVAGPLFHHPAERRLGQARHRQV